MKIRNHLRLKSNIIDPVTLVNVVVLIVVFFVLATHFIGLEGLNFVLPHSEQLELYEADSMVVSLVGDKAYLYDKEISPSELEQEITKKGPKLIAIKAEKNIIYSKFIEVVSLAKRMGIEQIAIATDTKPR